MDPPWFTLPVSIDLEKCYLIYIITCINYLYNYVICLDTKCNNYIYICKVHLIYNIQLLVHVRSELPAKIDTKKSSLYYGLTGKLKFRNKNP